MKKNALTIILFVVLIGAGAGFLSYRSSTPIAPAKSSTTQTASPTPGTVTYQGEDGKTALDLLKQHATVETKGEGTNAYVTSINGYTASDAKKEFWEMDVNGSPSQVGAGSYTTKSSDTISWKIATY